MDLFDTTSTNETVSSTVLATIPDHPDVIEASAPSPVAEVSVVKHRWSDLTQNEIDARRLKLIKRLRAEGKTWAAITQRVMCAGYGKFSLQTNYAWAGKRLTHDEMNPRFITPVASPKAARIVAKQPVEMVAEKVIEKASVNLPAIIAPSSIVASLQDKKGQFLDQIANLEVIILKLKTDAEAVDAVIRLYSDN